MNNSMTLILNSTQFVYFMGVVFKWQENAISAVFRGQCSEEIVPICVGGDEMVGVIGVVGK